MRSRRSPPDVVRLHVRRQVAAARRRRRRVKDASAEAVRESGKTRVYIQGNIHGGEVEGKEALQMLLRELSRGEHADWLQSMVLLVAPIYNADGNDRVRLERAQRAERADRRRRHAAERAGSRSQSRSHEARVARSAIAGVAAATPTIRTWRRSAHDQRQLSRVSPDLFAAAPSEHGAEDRRRGCAATGCRRSRRRSRRRMAGTSTTTATCQPAA